MIKQKSQTLFNRVLSLSLVITLLLGTFTVADIFYPTNTAMAASSFTSSGSGVTAPGYNKANYPELDTTGTKNSTAIPVRKYYYGKYGNEFYGVTDNSASGTWELVDTDGKMNGTALKSVWNTSSGKGCTILDNVNNLTSTYFNSADKAGMKASNISTDAMAFTNDYNISSSNYYSETTKNGVYLWPLSASQYILSGWSANGAGFGRLQINGLAKALFNNAHSDVIWSRSYAGYINGSCKAWYFGEDAVAGGVEYSLYVAPAFNLDLSKVLIARGASSSTATQSFATASSNAVASSASGDLKFLVNAGAVKSSFTVPSISGKMLTNVFAGTTYEFDYSGANTSALNGGTNYVSAILYDSSGKVAYYGNLGTITSATGKASITIPSGLTGTYTMALFQEEKCAAKMTDYASNPVYAKFTVQEVDWENNAVLNSTKPVSVEVGDTINSNDFAATVTTVKGITTTNSDNVFVVSSTDFAAAKSAGTVRNINSKSVTVPNTSPSFKLTAVYIPPTHTTGNGDQYTSLIANGYVSKEYTFNLNYESKTAFSTSHAASFSLNDTISSKDFSGVITWLAGNKTSVSDKDLYIVPTSVWGSGMSKDKLAELDTYSGGKSIKITDSILDGAQSFKITAVYFPQIAGASTYHTQIFEFASASLYSTAFEAVYNGPDVDYGDLLTDNEFSGKYTLSDGDGTKAEATTKYVLPTETWDSLDDSVRQSEARLKKVHGVNSTVVPSESELNGKTTYDITVVYFDYSDQHSHGGGVDCGNCNMYSAKVSVPLMSAVVSDYNSYTALGITWYYQVDEDGNAVNVHTVNENINQVVDKNGVLNIPKTVDGYPVKSIGTGLKTRPFVPRNVNSFTSIHFPDTLTHVNDYAFYSNESFMRLELPATVASVGNFAFYDCDNISDLKVVSTAIGTAAFGNCDGLVEVNISGTGSVGKVAFAECKNLTKLTVGGKNDIGKSSFEDDENINAVNLKNLKSSTIEAYAFKDCTGIKALNIPNTNTVKGYAFNGCSSITNLELDIATVENHSFEGCFFIQYMIFGENVDKVEYNWGGYSNDLYENNDNYSERLDTVLYAKNKGTLFETYRDGTDIYSSFMGHYVEGGSYKYSRVIQVYVSGEGNSANEHTINGTLVSATLNYYATAKDDIAEGDYTYWNYATAKNLLTLNITTNAETGDASVTLPSQRDGITAYYNGKIYDNEKADKSKIIVNPIYSDAVTATDNITDFWFFDEDEADTAIRAWMQSTDYEYENVLGDKGSVLKDGETYKYSDYIACVTYETITTDELAKQLAAMIQSVFDDEKKFLEAMTDVVDNPTIHEVTNNQDFNIQHMQVIFYPDKDTSVDLDYNAAEPAYYQVSIDVKVIKYSDEEYFFDQGFTYENVAQQVKELNNNIETLSKRVTELEDINNSLAEENHTMQEELSEVKQQLNQCVTAYNHLVEAINEYIGSTDVDADGYFGTKIEKDESGNVITKPVVWVNGTECDYTKTDETVTIDGVSYDVYTGTGDINGDGTADSFKFYVAPDGVHVIEMNGTETDQLYADTIRALERKLTAQITAIRTQLEKVEDAILNLANLLGIDDSDLADKTGDEQLAIIYEKVNALITEKTQLEAEIAETEGAIEQYSDALAVIYRQLTGGTLTENDVTSLQNNLAEILTKISALQSKNSSLVSRVAALEKEIERLGGEINTDEPITDDSQSIIENLNTVISGLEAEIAGYKTTVADLTKQLESLGGTAEGWVLTVEDAADLFGTSKDASSSEVKAAINAFISAKVEAEDTITKIQYKLGTDATGDALVALVEPSSSEDKAPDADLVAKIASLTSTNAALLSENSALKKEVSTLSSALQTALSNNKNDSGNDSNKELAGTISTLTEQLAKVQAQYMTLLNEKTVLEGEKAALEREKASLESKNASLSSKNKSLQESNKALKDTNAALNKKVDTLTSKNKSLSDQLASLKNANNSKVTTPTASSVSKVSTATASATTVTAPQKNTTESTPDENKADEKKATESKAGAEEPENKVKTPTSAVYGIQSERTPTEKQSGKGVSINLPGDTSVMDVSGASVTGLKEDSLYASDIKSNGAEIGETSAEQKEHANTIFAYYANHLGELAKLGWDEIDEVKDDDSKKVIINAVASVDISPSEAQKESFKEGRTSVVSLSADNFVDGNMYLVVHESDVRTDMYDIFLVQAQNNSLEFELADLSPVSVAEVSITDVANFDLLEDIPGEAEIAAETGSNGVFKTVFAIILMFVIILGGVIVIILNKKGKLSFKYARK